jgi:hypothetical protein
MAGIEHFSTGLIAQRFAPRLSLGWLLVASEFLDVLWMFFMLIGMDHELNLVLTHGLFMSVVWSLAGGIAAVLIYKALPAGIIFGTTIFSHWVMDFITHTMGFLTGSSTPDLPLLFADSPRVGLGLYNTLPGVLIGAPLLLAPGVVLVVLYIREKLRARQGKHSVPLPFHKRSSPGL